MTGLRTICNARKNELGISSAEIAEQSGLSVSTVRNFLGGSGKAPSIQTVTLICKVLGVSLDDYFGISCQHEDPQQTQQDTEIVEMLKTGIKTRNRILFIVLIFNLILLVSAVLVHITYY